MMACLFEHDAPGLACLCLTAPNVACDVHAGFFFFFLAHSLQGLCLFYAETLKEVKKKEVASLCLDEYFCRHAFSAAHRNNSQALERCHSASPRASVLKMQTLDIENPEHSGLNWEKCFSASSYTSNATHTA